MTYAGSRGRRRKITCVRGLTYGSALRMLRTMHGTPTHRRFETLPMPVDLEPLRALVDVVPARAFLQPEGDSAVRPRERAEAPADSCARQEAEPSGH